jgi:hypothetical protein
MSWEAAYLEEMDARELAAARKIEKERAARVDAEKHRVREEARDETFNVVAHPAVSRRIEAEYDRILQQYGEEAARHVIAAIDDAIAKGGRRSLGSTDFDAERMVQVVTVSIPSMHYRFYVAPDILDMRRR